MFLIRVLFALCFAFYSVDADGFYFKEKPEFLRTCYKSDPKFEDCSKIAVQKLFDTLSEGIKEVNLPPLDPLKIKKLRILQGDGPVNVNAALEDVTVSGFGKTRVISSEVKGKSYNFFTKVHVPQMKIEGTYNLRGKILLIPLIGRGKCWFEPSDLDIDIISNVTPYKRDEFVFFNVTSVHVKFSIGGLKLRMDNLFDGIKSLEESTNTYLNANWRPVAESLRPILARTIEDIMLGILQKIFHGIPANFWIGDIKIYD